jgi:nicotinate-nucleotide pyrophosphorylase (carboxylating)
MRVQGFPARIVDTRKTTPGLRAAGEIRGARRGRFQPPLQPQRRGAHQGQPHRRLRLDHRGGGQGAGGVPHTIRIEVETDTLAQVEECLSCGVGVIMLDNMDLATLRRAVP